MRKTLAYLGFIDPAAEQQSTRVSARPEQRPAPVRPVAPVRTLSRSRQEPAYSVIHTMRPRQYTSDASGIAETFAGGSPIVVDMSHMQDSEARRLIDFMSGLVQGLDGTIRKVSLKVFMLTPAGIEQFDDERDQNSLQVNASEEFLD